MAQLGDRLRELRKQRGMTQKDLEARSGVPQNSISRIEIGGVQEISTKTLVGLARALEVTTDTLLGFSLQPVPPRRPGVWKGQIWIADTFDDEDPALSRLFEAGECG